VSTKRLAPNLPTPTRRDLIAATDGPGPRLRDAYRIDLALIDPNPDQPRRLADADRLAELAADVAERGILEPLIVRPSGDGRYQVIAGGRRRAAAEIAGLADVPCLVREDLSDDEARAVALVENLQREDLDPEDEGRAFAVLVDQGWSQRKIAQAIHKSHQYVMRRLQLIDNPAALAAWRAGMVDLTELLSVDPAPPVATLAEAAQTAAAQLLQPGENGPDRTTDDHAAPHSAPPVYDEQRAEWHAQVFKPFPKMQQHARRTMARLAEAPAEERIRLKHTIGDTIDVLTELYQAIDAEAE
jgi:ParB/RepB/Spo0J family partition protein